MGQYHPPPVVWPFPSLPPTCSSSLQTPPLLHCPSSRPAPAPAPQEVGVFHPGLVDGKPHSAPLPPSPSWPGLFLESARWLIVKRQIEEAQSVLRILAERNRPHGQMLGEEAQEALQGKRQGPHPCRRTPGAQLFLLTAPLSPKTWRTPALSLQHPPFPSLPSSTTAASGKICLSWASPSEPGCRGQGPGW